MKQEEFDRLFNETQEELQKHGISLIRENIDVNKLRCEWAKNNADFGTLYATKGNATLSLEESGSMDYVLLDNYEEPIATYDTDMCKNKTFADAFKNFKSDDDIKKAEDKGTLVAEENNWFELIYTEEDKDIIVADDDVLYSLDEFLNANRIIEIFDKMAK